MNNVYTRNKKKRSRSTSGDGKNSFVQNVTARMTGFLPATITKWFSSPTTSNANGSTMAEDSTDSSTEEELLETADASILPPVKRMRFSTNISSVPAYAYSEGTSTLEKWSNQPQNSTSMVHSTPEANALKRGSIFSSTSMRETPEVKFDANTSSGDTEFNLTAPSSYAHSFSSTGVSLQRKRKSLFDNASLESNSETRLARSVINTSRYTKEEPTFRASLLGSPFYKGQTMYGGAGASYYRDEPNINQRSFAIVNEARSSDDSISGASRRVMDILESYSSPLSEARRIPSYTKSPYKRNCTDVPSKKTSISQLQSIQVPSVGSFLNIKQRFRLMDSTSAARQIMASQSSTTDFMPYVPSHKRNKLENSSLGSTQVSSIKPRLKSSSKNSARRQDELPPPVDIPSAALNMDHAELPKFSFGVSSAPSKSVTSIVDNTQKPSSGTLNVINIGPTPQDDMVIDSTFKFSSPIRITSKDFSPTIIIPPSVTSIFDKVTPLSPLEKTSEVTEIKVSNKDDSKEWRCGDCWVNNKASIDKCVCCGSTKPSARVEGTTCKCIKCKTLECEANSDICIACKKVSSNLTDKLTVKNPSTSTWKCDSCWVSNSMSDEKCVCCAGKRVLDKTDDKIGTKSTESAEHKLEVKSSLLTSNSDALPSKSSIIATNALPKSESFKPLVVASQSNQWQCPSCLVGNDNSKLNCLCCETEKPGTVKDSNKKIFSFGIPNTGFKFGIQPQEKEDKSKAIEKTVKLQNNSQETETNNNSLKSAPTFSFGMPPSVGTAEQKDVNNKLSPAAITDTNEAFALGNNTDYFKTPIDSDMLTTQSAIEKEERQSQNESEKEQEVPKAFAPIKLGQQTLSPSTYFGSFTNKQDSISSEPTFDKITTSKTIVAEPISEQTKPLFTFSLKSAEQNQIDIQTAVTASVPPNPLLSTPAITGASLFSTETTTTPPQMFHKVESTAATVQPTTAPIFSFGSNKAAQPVNENQAKFNFSFNSTVFAPPFKTNTESSNSNALGTPQSSAVNTLAGGNSLISNMSPITSNIFGSAIPVANESNNMWATPASATPQASVNNVKVPNIFSSSTPSNALSKPAFDFGSSPFKVGNLPSSSVFTNSSPNTAAFGNPLTANNMASTFGNPLKSSNNLEGPFASPQMSINSSPFGNNQCKSDVFGIQTQQMTNQPSIFMNKDASNNVFGIAVKSSAMLSTQAPALAGNPLDASSAPNFNFNNPGIFSFNQPQQQPQQQPQHGVYSFGATPNVAPQVQFNMGSPGNMASTPNTLVRKVRKAVRRR